MMLRASFIQNRDKHGNQLSPWQKLRASQNDQAYITMMGIDCESFEKILERFALLFFGHTPFDSSGMIVEFEYTMG
jgi:hypothetical protein